jgi:hypothetical protein
MHKKFIAWIAAAALFAASFPAVGLNAAEEGFTDIGNHWAKDLIIKFTEQDVLTGYPDGTFKPDGNLTRAEAVTLLNKYFNITQSGYPDFKDVVPDDWFYFQVGSAYDRGYISGYPDGTFKPNGKITRMESFIMLYNLLGMPQYEDESVIKKFTDYGDIPLDKPVYRQIIAYMAGNGIINAYPDGSLKANGFITRAEMLSLLNKISDMITNSNSLVPEATPEPTPATTETPEETPTPEPTQAPAAGGNNWPVPQPPGVSGSVSPSALSPSALGSVSFNSLGSPSAGGIAKSSPAAPAAPATRSTQTGSIFRFNSTDTSGDLK